MLPRPLKVATIGRGKHQKASFNSYLAVCEDILMSMSICHKIIHLHNVYSLKLLAY